MHALAPPLLHPRRTSGTSTVIDSTNRHRPSKVHRMLTIMGLWNNAVAVEAGTVRPCHSSAA